MPTDFAAPVTLGRAGLTVGRLGLGASYGAPAAAYEEAFERGLNCFYWGTRRHVQMGRAIRSIAARDRDRLVLCVQSYTRVGLLLGPSVHLALRQLRLECADVLLLGLWNGPIAPGVLDAALRLKERGVVRRLAVSAHERTAFQQHLAQPAVDLIMVRYNAAHRGAEQDVFPYLQADRAERPGVLTYTTTRWGGLLDPKRMPAGTPPPRGRDLYRFSLSHPDVDLTMCGPSSTAQLREAMAALEEGPMDEQELARMHRIGDAVYPTPSAASRIARVIRS